MIKLFLLLGGKKKPLKAPKKQKGEMDDVSSKLDIEVKVSVLPIDRTCRTALVCASDYDDQMKF